MNFEDTEPPCDLCGRDIDERSRCPICERMVCLECAENPRELFCCDPCIRCEELPATDGDYCDSCRQFMGERQDERAAEEM